MRPKRNIAVENAIVEELAKAFPGDAIMAEEGYATTSIPDGRIWIIDPICGTNNLGRGLSSFCTNIALADGGELIASCVVDHAKGDYFWSVGDGVHVNDSPLDPHALDDRPDVCIDVDLGALMKSDVPAKDRHCRAVRTLVDMPGYVCISLNSSLGFAYMAIGKIDGLLNACNHPWDVAAGAFLIQQAGGIITDTEGNPWSLASNGVIGARTAGIHQALVDSYAAQ